MKHKHVFGLFIAVMLLSGASCKKNETEPQLPSITQTGKNTFGCLVNGEVWVAKAYPMKSKGGANLDNHELYNNEKVWEFTGANNDEHIVILIPEQLMTKGLIPLNKNNTLVLAYFTN